ncbi:hypothetical protein PO909_004892 [Leuciscus waleckii]
MFDKNRAVVLGDVRFVERSNGVKGSLPCQGERIGSKMMKVKGGKRSRARPSAFQKHTLWEYQHALEHGEPTRCWRAITARCMVSKSPTALLEHKGDDTRMDDLPWLAGTAACIRFPVKVTRQ